MTTADLFAVLGLPKRFDTDPAMLEKIYFEAQRKFHPDRLAGKSAQERQQNIAQSMLINDAYQTLKSPLKRAQHLLALTGVAPDSVKPSGALLMEIMEFREALAEAKDAAMLKKLTQQNDDARKDTLVSLANAFSTPDLRAAAELAIRLSYIVKIEDEIRIRSKLVA